MIEKLRYVTVLDNMLQICGLLLVIVIVSIAYVCIHKKQSSYDPKVNNMKDNEYRNIRIVLLLFDFTIILLFINKVLLTFHLKNDVVINGIMVESTKVLEGLSTIMLAVVISALYRKIVSMIAEPSVDTIDLKGTIVAIHKKKKFSKYGKLTIEYNDPEDLNKKIYMSELEMRLKDHPLGSEYILGYDRKMHLIFVKGETRRSRKFKHILRTMIIIFFCGGVLKIIDAIHIM